MLARRSPPTARVVQVLDFLRARHPARFGLSEVARHLAISKPTCLGILTELVAGGYLVRDQREKTYGLGPALNANRAGEHLAALSDRFQTTCTSSAVVGDQIVVLEASGGLAKGGLVKVGQVYPFAPPIGLMYVLWGPDSALQRWLARPPTLPMKLDEARLGRVVQECRQRRYLVESLTPAGMRLHSLMAGIAAYDLPDEVRELVAEMASSLGERVYLDSDLARRGKHPVSLIAAPTFDADHNQELVLTMHVGKAITRAEIARLGNALVKTADAVTAQVLRGAYT